MAAFVEPSVLQEIYKFSKCEYAFMTTFDFDIHFFNASVFPMLYRNRARVCLFVDSNQFQESIKKQTEGNIGDYYYVHPFRMNKAFHPKVILLLNKNEAKLIISSANLTNSGHYLNNELFQSFSYSNEDKQHLGLIVSAFNFFKNLATEAGEGFVDNLLEDASNQCPFLLGNGFNTKTSLLTSYSESIFNQIIGLMDKDIKEIRVAVPFYDENLSALKHLKNKYSNAKICLYLQETSTTFPKEKYSEELIDEVTVFKEVVNNDINRSRFYHGKVFCFISENKEYILYGSSNFSYSALLESYKNGGNIEANIFEEGNIGDYSVLFNSFIPSDKKVKDIQTRPTDIKEESGDSKVVFVKGKIEGNVQILLKAHDLDPESVLSVSIGDKVVNNVVSKTKEGLFITFNERPSQNIFDLIIKTVDDEFSIRCFVCNIDSLNAYNNSTAKNPFKYKFETANDIENYDEARFLEFFEKLKNDIAFGIEQEKKLADSQKQQDVNDDTTYEESDEDADLDSSSYEEQVYAFADDSSRIYDDVKKYLNYYSEKTSNLLSKKTEKTTTNKETDEQKKRRERKTSSLAKYLYSFGSKDNHKLDNLTFDLYCELYGLFSNTFITDIYLKNNFKADIENIVVAKINYLINRVFPLVSSVEKSNKNLEYLKKEIALLCLECWNINKTEVFDFKDELILLDRQSENTFIEEIKRLMVEVGTILEIRNMRDRLDHFKNNILASPLEGELMKMLCNQFSILSSSNNLCFNDNNLRINIEVIAKSKKIPDFGLTKTIKTAIINYTKRTYECGEEQDISFEINLFNYNENTKLMNYKYECTNSKIYTQYIEFKNGRHPVGPYNYQFKEA